MLSQQDQTDLRELRIRQAEDAWQKFLGTHPDFVDNHANRQLICEAFIVRDPQGRFIGEHIPTAQMIEAAYEERRDRVAHRKPEPDFNPPEQPEPTPLQKVEEYNNALRSASKETLRDINRIQSALSIGLQPNTAEWAQRRLPVITEEIHFLLNPPQPVDAVKFQSASTPQLTVAQQELGRRLQAVGINVSPDRNSMTRWIRSEDDAEMSDVRKFLRARDGRINRENEAALQSVLRGE